MYTQKCRHTWEKQADALTLFSGFFVSVLLEEGSEVESV